MKDREQLLENSNPAEKKTRLRAPLRAALLVGALGAVLALAKEEDAVLATDNSTDPQTRNTLSLEKPPNQEEYSQVVQTGTRVVGTLEIPIDQKAEEADLQALREILTGAQEWFSQNIGATFALGDIQFVESPNTTAQFFEDVIILPKVGVPTQEAGLGAACDQGVNRANFPVTVLIGWRNQTERFLGFEPGFSDIVFIGPCLDDDGLGTVQLNEDNLDTRTRDEAIRRLVLGIANGTALGTSGPRFADWAENPQFTREQIEKLRRSPLFTIVDPNFQQPQESAAPTADPAAPSGETIHLDGIWNFVTNTAAGCQSPESVFQSLIDGGMPFTAWVFNPASGQWEGFDSQFPQVSDLKEICHLQVVAVRPKDQVDWQPNVRTLRDDSRDYGNGVIGPSLADQKLANRPKQTAKV